MSWYILYQNSTSRTGLINEKLRSLGNEVCGYYLSYRIWTNVGETAEHSKFNKYAIYIKRDSQVNKCLIIYLRTGNKSRDYCRGGLFEVKCQIQ